LLQEWRKDKQAPDAVDDARNARQQLNRGADRAPQPHRAKFSEKQRDKQTDWDGNHHRDDGSDDGTVNRRDRAELLGDRIPALGDKEAETELAEGKTGAPDQRCDDGAEQDQHRHGGGAGQPPKAAIAEAQALKNPGALGRGLLHHRPIV
jgi:hypothetical protein